MGNFKIITGTTGEDHITPLQDGMWHKGMMGRETCVLRTGRCFKHTVVSNTLIRIADGIMSLQGRFMCIDTNEHEDVSITSGTSGRNRVDIICAKLSIDEAGISTTELEVVQGTSTTGVPTEPVVQTGSLDDNDPIVRAPLYRVKIEGINITEVTRMFDFFNEPVQSTAAGFHNSIFRGKDLTNIYTVDEICSRIAAGTFEDLWLGDYFDIHISPSGLTAQDVRCRIAGFDCYWMNGDSGEGLKQHHAVIVPDNSFSNTAYMNSSNTTAGGYAGSNMHTTTIPKYNNALAAAAAAAVPTTGGALGSHLLTRRSIMSNAVSSGASSNWAWADVKCRLMTETELFGAPIWAKSGYDTGEGKCQLPLFSIAPEFIRAGSGGTDKDSSRATFWLSGVASAAAFALCYGNGRAGNYDASSAYGVRPLFCIG